MKNVKTAEQTAERLGREHGTSAASWYFDGGESLEKYERVLRGMEEGDPEVVDTFPASPLSGEWADSYGLADLSADTGVSMDDDAFEDVCRVYEDAFDMAVTTEIWRVAKLNVS